MPNSIQKFIDHSSQEQIIFAGFSMIILLSLFIALATDSYFLVGIPAVFIIVFLSIVNYRFLYFLLLFCLPLSTEVTLPNGFGTDLPTEPLIVGLMIIYLLVILQKGSQTDTRFLRHPISLLLLVHLFWMFSTTLVSSLPLVSIKFFLAKCWYIVVFYFLSASLIKTEKDFRQFFWIIFIPLVLTVVVTLVRHSAYGFSFKDIHKVLHPYQRNHVNYAACMALFFPIVWMAIWWYKRWSLKWLILVGTIGILTVAIYLSYTRAAYVALAIALGAYVIFRFRLIRYAIVVSIITGILGINYLSNQNTYLDYAPNYDRTVTHKKFDNLIEATYNMEDISTMERLYRWIAGAHMSADRPMVGYGPGNFVNFYKPYAVTSFQTYVSDNEENSGIHSYYLMTLVEQGFIGLLIFLLLTFYVLLQGERIYHQTKDIARKRIVMMVLLCTIVIDAFLLINDLIETDKVGPFFFICIAVLVNIDLQNQNQSTAES